MTAPEAMPSRRGVLEGAVVALAAGVGGFAWFSAAGPAGEDELDEQEEQQEEQEEQQDELDEEQDELDEEQDEQDEDNSGPGGGDDEDDSGHGNSHDDDDDS